MPRWPGGSCDARGDSQEVSLRSLRGHQYLGQLLREGTQTQKESSGSCGELICRGTFRNYSGQPPHFTKELRLERLPCRASGPLGHSLTLLPSSG